MSKVNKYLYARVIQGNFGYGWEDMSVYLPHERDDLKHDLLEYRMSHTYPGDPFYSYRVVSRRIPNPDYSESE